MRRKRLDVAELCLSQMGHVRGARAARDAARFAEPDARVAAVATHLGLLEDAERLYRDCGRFDLLANLHRASGRWRDAARVAAARDRVHLKSTHYAHARHLESLGDVAGAVRAYEKSGRAHREVPRLLRARGETRALEAYLDAATRREEEETAEEKENAARLRLWRALLGHGRRRLRRRPPPSGCWPACGRGRGVVILSMRRLDVWHRMLTLANACSWWAPRIRCFSG